MKWFKCFSDNHRGRTIQRLLDEVGHSGACLYYFLMEMCAEKLQKTGPNPLSDSDCIFTFNRKVIQSVTRMKLKSIQNAITIGAECGAWEAKSIGNEIEIKMPILLNLLDRDLKKPRLSRDYDAKMRRPDKDKDKDKEKEEDIATTIPAAPGTENSFSPKKLIEFWNNNCAPLPRVTKLSEARRRKCIAQIKLYPEIEHWADVLNKFKESTFVCETWRPGIDAFLSEDIRLRAIEGRYSNRRDESETQVKYYDEGF